MPQLMWQNTNDFDEWREVSGILKGSLVQSGVQITKSVDATRTIGETTRTELWRRVVKVEDGFYAEFFNLQGALLADGLALGPAGDVPAQDSTRIASPTAGTYSGGWTSDHVYIGIASSTLVVSQRGARGTAEEEPSVEILRGNDARFGGIVERYAAIAATGSDVSIIVGTPTIGTHTDLPGGRVTQGYSFQHPLVSGSSSLSVSFPNQYYPALSGCAGGLVQMSITQRPWGTMDDFYDGHCGAVFGVSSGSRCWLLSTTYLRVAPSVDASGELVNPTQFVALPLVSTLIVGDGVLAAVCIPVGNANGSGCFVVAGKMGALNSNAESFSLAILRKAPILWGTPETRTRYMTAHTVGSVVGSQDAYTMDYWRGTPPVATDSKMGGIVAATPYIYGSGVAPELRGSFDAVEFCADSVSLGASAWKGSKRYLCVDKGLLLRTI